MKKISGILFLVCGLMNGYAQLLPGYNSMFYSNVKAASEGTGQAFFLMQGIMTMSGVTVEQDSLLRYQNKLYKVHSKYQNPVTGNTNHYYIEASEYPSYQLGSMVTVWPEKIPNILYNNSDSVFNSLADCVGYGTRLLSATGDATTSGNAYLSLIAEIKQANTTMFAEPGWVASAYEFGAALATLPGVNDAGWGYVAGNVLPDSINAYNHRTNPALNPYNGTAKTGFNNSIPGDILAFSYRPGGSSNGHFMVLTHPPYRIDYDTVHHYYPNVPPDSVNAFLSRYHLYATPVYDCSGKNQHFNDSRKFMSGIGHGTLWILADPSDETPMGYIFEPPAPGATAINSYVLGPSHLWAITIGRYKNGGLGLEDQGDHTGKSPSLMQNFPNPVKTSTCITYFLPSAGKVSIRIYSMKGILVETLVDEVQQGGSHSCIFPVGDLPSGSYTYSISFGERSIVKRMIILQRPD